MTVWQSIAEQAAQVTGNPFLRLLEALRTAISGDPETRAQVAFSAAMIALSAKMAKADGVVTAEEVEAFRELFQIPDGEADNVSRLYNLAKQDVAGYDAYASRVATLFANDPDILQDVLDGLFHIAKADGIVHDDELAFIFDVAAIFGIDEVTFEAIRMRHVEVGSDPYLILGAERDWDMKQIKAHYRRLVRENHPDRLTARGVPAECISIANDRLAAINDAFAHIERLRFERV